MNSSWLGKLQLSLLLIFILVLSLGPTSHAYYGMYGQYGGLYSMGGLSSTVQLIGNNTFSGIFNVFGEGTATFVQLSGQDPSISYAITITALLPTPTTMEGWYDIYKLPNLTATESGTFALDLIATAVI